MVENPSLLLRCHARCSLHLGVLVLRRLCTGTIHREDSISILDVLQSLLELKPSRRTAEVEATMQAFFWKKLDERVRTNESLLCVGLDPHAGQVLTSPLLVRCVVTFNFVLIRLVSAACNFFGRGCLRTMREHRCRDQRICRCLQTEHRLLRTVWC